jgi:rubrerythrin
MNCVEENRAKLIAILQLAYSGELAAANAYRGHWQSVARQDEADAIRAIEEDELRHRQLVGDMLVALGAQPNQRRERRAAVIGRTLGMLCHVTGWLAPMYGAGKLESRNVKEYEAAARYARDCGCADFINCLLEMAEVEWEHEKYFRECVLRHPLGRRLRLWSEPPPKEMIRRTFERETIASAVAADSQQILRPATPQPSES